MAQYWLTDPASADPWASLGRLARGLDEWATQWGARPTRRAGVFPPVNLYEAADGFVLTAELPGLRSEEIEVTVERDRVTLRGQRRIEHPKDASLHRVERQAGTFRRTVQLPVEVASDKVDAVYRNGVLMLRIPKAPELRPRRISVASS
jgi:HSP20 family protein